MKKMGVKCIVTIMIVALVIIPSACKTPAAFEVTSLNITPAEAGLEELVTVTVDVENLGDVEGIYTASLTIDGIEVKRQDIWLGPRMRRTLTFDIGKDEAGDYTVEIGRQSRVLTVKKGFYRNSTYGFSISYPTSWVMEETGERAPIIKIQGFTGLPIVRVFLGYLPEVTSCQEHRELA